jgi:carbon storage regulator
MLVLSRKSMEAVLIGDSVVVHVLEIRGSRVRIGIDAPKNIRVQRTELLDRASNMSGNNSRATVSSGESYDPRSIGNIARYCGSVC